MDPEECGPQECVSRAEGVIRPLGVLGVVGAAGPLRRTPPPKYRNGEESFVIGNRMFVPR